MLDRIDTIEQAVHISYKDKERRMGECFEHFTFERAFFI